MDDVFIDLFLFRPEEMTKRQKEKNQSRVDKINARGAKDRAILGVDRKKVIPNRPSKTKKAKIESRLKLKLDVITGDAATSLFVVLLLVVKLVILASVLSRSSEKEPSVSFFKICL